MSMVVAQANEPKTESPALETIEELFESLESPLLGYALRLVGEFTVAEDLVQEAFMRLHTHFAQVREPRPWLFRTVHNLAVNHHARAGKIVSLEMQNDATTRSGPEMIDPQPSPDEEMTRLEGIHIVRMSVEALDDRSRELVRLKFHENLSYKEISDRTGLTIGHVGYLLHHALKAIAAEVSEAGVAP